AATLSQPWPDRDQSAVEFTAREYPPDFTQRHCDEVDRPWYSARAYPSAFSRPRQWATLGLPGPVNLWIASGSVADVPSAGLRIAPLAPSEKSLAAPATIAQFTRDILHEAAAGIRGRCVLIPVIH